MTSQLVVSIGHRADPALHRPGSVVYLWRKHAQMATVLRRTADSFYSSTAAAGGAAPILGVLAATTLAAP